MSHHGHFTLVVPGQVKVEERGPKDDAEWLTTIHLASEDRDETSLILYFNPEEVEGGEEDYEIVIHETHIENKETDRAFHISVHFILERSDLKKLHGYLGFLLGL